MMRINIERLKHSMDAINGVALTTDGGVSRVALTGEDKKARDMLKKWMLEEGLDVRVDDLGNMYGRRSGLDNAAGAVCVGSHLDTQPNGGRFDGTLGVLAALEIVRTLNENKAKTRYPVEIINWTNEEGARFQPALMGSGVIEGSFDKDCVYNKKDHEGKSFADELQKIGYMGDESNRMCGARAFFEMHVEQGPVLEKSGLSVGIVSGVSGTGWYNIVIKGTANHSGTCPMPLRQDALASAARIIVGIRDVVKKLRNDAVVTVGEISIRPGVINIIPSEAAFSIDLRCPEERDLLKLERSIFNIIEKVCQEEKTDYEKEKIWYSPPVDFDAKIIQTLQDASTKLGVPYKTLVSGANHDAKFVNSIAPTGMLFVRSVGGKSHCPDEFSEWNDIEHGTNVLFKAVLAFSN